MKAKDINSQRFEKVPFGYKQEDVEGFLNEISADYSQLERDNAEINTKLQLLAEKVKEYRKDEEAVKDALLFAQKEGHRVLTEAKAKADEMLKNAQLESERIMNEATFESKKSLENTKIQINNEQRHLAELQKQVSKFKKELFDTYKSHLEIISSLPQVDYSDDDEYEYETVSVQQPVIPQPAVQVTKQPAEQPVSLAAKETAPVEDKPDPFRTQSIPVIGGGDNKYSELQFGQQNSNK